MRCDQYRGLNRWARKLVEGTLEGAKEEGHLILADGTRVAFTRTDVPAVKKVAVVGYVKGAYMGRVAVRRRYTMHDGRMLEEVAQDKIWCGGPNYFMALLDTTSGTIVEKSLWTQKEKARFIG